MKNAVLMNERDNVAVLIEPLKKGEILIYRKADREPCSFAVLEDIPVYHKAAVCPIQKGERIIKYGECIGIASSDIVQGMHVHVHNVMDSGMQKGDTK